MTESAAGTMATAELNGQVLNYWMAKAAGLTLSAHWRFAADGQSVMIGEGPGDLKLWSVITDRPFVTALMERQDISAEWVGGAQAGAGGPWAAFFMDGQRKVLLHNGPTREVAVLRAYLAALHGDRVPVLHW